MKVMHLSREERWRSTDGKSSHITMINKEKLQLNQSIIATFALRDDDNDDDASTTRPIGEGPPFL